MVVITGTCRFWSPESQKLPQWTLTPTKHRMGEGKDSDSSPAIVNISEKQVSSGKNRYKLWIWVHSGFVKL